VSHLGFEAVDWSNVIVSAEIFDYFHAVDESLDPKVQSLTPIEI